jgi:aspartate/tyrosine/aromatic aminotransferase
MHQSALGYQVLRSVPTVGLHRNSLLLNNGLNVDVATDHDKIIKTYLTIWQNFKLHLHECCHGVYYLTLGFQEWQQVLTLFHQLQ